MNKIKQFHAHSLKSGIDFTKDLLQDLLQIPNLVYARKLFDLYPTPCLFLYNKLIQSYSAHHQPHESIFLFNLLSFNGLRPNHHTFTFVFSASASMSYPLPARMLHSRFCKSGFVSDSFCSTALIDTYAKLGLLGCARRVFDEMPERDIPVWNAMVSGYSRNGDMKSATYLFDSMPEKNVISWTAMISGFSQNGNYSKALSMFLCMEKDKAVKPNHITITSVLPACANLGALEIGQRIEAYARENGFFDNVYVSNAILELYTKCGKVEVANRVFDEIGKRRNLCSWNSMINGLAIHGKYNEALELYAQMLQEGIKPDDVTFVGLLLACVHGGMVIKGRELFESMAKIFNTSPKLEHYGCMVDLLGRAGKLQEAYILIKTMPMKPDAVVWGTLLGACSVHGNEEIAEVASEALFKLEPSNPGNYVIMSNIYARTEKWDGVSRLRKMMKSQRITKAAGYSFLEEGGEVHKFMVEDKSHPKSDEIYEVLNEIFLRMKLEKSSLFSELQLEQQLCTLE
ncbi:PREDICTED: pentatricopeptide repeat-containing protein At5g08510 [Tarenaya hassleriana]|uniref:pentatricopeptide repeat-containing protein At5g08510 n=1 Tax=Tarenaya hassleriana TaxID=28532 RepID=UPI00053C1DB1|nr:PREDICTED: pentatricopeptide repeat-containing protein At5g08510 [Tarenaya hassleriana]